MHRLLQISLCLALLVASCSRSTDDALRAQLGAGYDQLEDYRFSQADTTFGRELSANPSSPIGLYGKGLVHERRFEYYDALEKYMSIIQSNPDFAPAYAAAAEMLRLLGDPELAVIPAQGMVKRTESPGPAYIDLAATLLDSRKFTEASRALHSADSVGVGATWIDLVSARSHALRLQIDSASAAFNRASNGMEKTPHWYQLAADYYEARGNTDSAVAMSRMAVTAPGADQGQVYAHFLRCLKLRYDTEAGQLARQIAEKAGEDFAAHAANLRYNQAIGNRIKADQNVTKLIRRKELLYSTLMYEAQVRWSLADYQTTFDNLETMARNVSNESVSPEFADFINGVVVLFENEMGDDESVYKRIQDVGGFRTERVLFRMAQAEMFLRGGGEEQFAQAVQAMETGHGHQPEWLLALGKLHWGRVRRDSISAEKYFTRALEKDPSFQPALNELIDLFTWHGQFTRAAELFVRYPQFERVSNMLVRKAYCQVRAGQVDGGTSTYLDAMSQFPANISRHEDFYSFLVSRGLTEQAGQVAQRSLEMNPKDPLAYALAARAATDRGDYQKGLELADQGLDIDANLTGLSSQKARALYLSGKKPEGVALFESLLKQVRMDGDVLYYFSRCLASDKSELPRAADLARQAQFVESGSYRATLNLSYVYYQAGQAAEARAEAARVYGTYPYEPEPAYMLAMTLAQEGNPEAHTYFDRALALGLTGALREKAQQSGGTF